MTQKHPKVLKKLAIAFAIVVLATVVYVKALEPHTLEAKQRTQLESTQHQLLDTKRLLNQQKTLNAKQDAEKAKQLQDIQKKLEETEKALQAKRSVPSTPTAYAEAPASYSMPADQAKAFIYSHESGNNPGAINEGSGACGLGQALPCSKLPCSLSDYACQDAWFTNYMLQRYGSWANAVSFWQANRWW